MDYQHLRSHHVWRADTALSQNFLSHGLRPWLTDKGSLTAALIALSEGNFGVTVLSQKIALPFFHEQTKLQRPLARAAMIREVELTVHGEAVVYARSIIPLSLIMNGRSGLANIGRTPLGHLLFRDGQIRVSKRDFASVKLDQHVIHARRTPYDYQGSRILVSEFFLPALENWR